MSFLGKHTTKRIKLSNHLGVRRIKRVLLLQVNPFFKSQVHLPSFQPLQANFAQTRCYLRKKQSLKLSLDLIKHNEINQNGEL
jgi:hypothetical protein